MNPRGGKVQTLRAQQKSAANLVTANVANGSRSHLFEVIPFASRNSALSQLAQAQVPDLDALRDALGRVQAYYDAQRANAPSGATTPKVQPEDWKLVEGLVNAIKACPEFAKLAPALSNSIEALQPLLRQPGPARYYAWTVMCRAFKDNRHAGDQALSARPPAPLKRQSSAPAAAPRRKPTVSCQAACQGLALLSKGIQTVGNQQQIAWHDVRQGVNAIVSSGDFQTHFSPDQQEVFKKLQKLNAKDSGLPGRFGAWQDVQKLLAQDAGPSRAAVGQLRQRLTAMTNNDVWMTSDCDALIQLCHTERFKPEWSSDLSQQMHCVEIAVQGNAQNAGGLMANLLASLNQKFPPA